LPKPSFDPVDHLLALDPGRRGIAAFFQPGAARRAAEALRGSRRVLITTGFAVEPKMPETDGPPGAAVLGRALRALGVQVSYVTDPVTIPILGAALRVLREPPDVQTYADGPRAAADVLERARPTHLVAIERPGRSRSGDYLNMRGHSVAEWNRPIDELFVCCSDRAASGSRGRWPERGARGSARSDRAASGSRGRWPERDGRGSARSDRAASGSRGRWPERDGRGSARSDRAASGSRGRWPERDGRGSARRPVTIGVGDGGNEVGMGNVRARLARVGALMARIASTVTVDHLVVAGVSNWGAYGIVAHLGHLTGRRLLHTPEQERDLVNACVEAGAHDGVTRRREPTVDALPLEAHAAVVALLAVSWGP
jgi:hypothetical protein